MEKPDRRKWRGTLTVEAALVLPLILFAMISVLQYAHCMETSVRMANALTETGKSIAAASYAVQYTGEKGQTAAGILSTAYAQQKVLAKAGDTSGIKNATMLLSSFLQEENLVSLVMTYQIRSPFGIFQLPGNCFVQCAVVRAWVGRSTEGGTGGGEKQLSQNSCVYVTTTGTVYHEDPECTYLKLSIREVSKNELADLRNNSGEIYHVCELCGASGSETVYITAEGNRCHSSLACSGLKRTVMQVTREETGHLRACSKCGGIK